MSQIPARPGRYFSWDEWARSSRATALGLDNDPRRSREDALRIVAWCRAVGDPFREFLGRPLRITSGYRSAALNRALGGSRTSQHVLGEAADLKVEGLSAEALAWAILESKVPFDQLIWYAPSRGGHVHLSYTERRANRGEVRYAPPDGGYPLARPKAPK